MEDTGHQFTTIYGRNLVGELKIFVHRPYLVVTMADLWEKFKPHFDQNLARSALKQKVTLDVTLLQKKMLPNKFP